MDNQKEIILPDAKEIMRRLGNIDMGGLEENLRKDFYPLVAQEGGQRMAAQGVVMMLMLKIDDVVSSGYPTVFENILRTSVPDFIDALVYDQDVALEAKRFYHKASG